MLLAEESQTTAAPKTSAWYHQIVPMATLRKVIVRGGGGLIKWEIERLEIKIKVTKFLIDILLMKIYHVSCVLESIFVNNLIDGRESFPKNQVYPLQISKGQYLS